MPPLDATAGTDQSGPLSVGDAFRAISAPPPKRDDNTDTSTDTTDTDSRAALDDDSDPVTRSADDADASPDDDGRPVPGDTDELDPDDGEDDAGHPSIEPPRSWSKEHKEAFAALPRHLQQTVAESERAREAEFLSRTREAADKAKAQEAEVQAAIAARQKYEQALPRLLQSLDAVQADEFADIKTPEDVLRMAQETPARYVRFDALQKQRAAVSQEFNAAQQRDQNEAVAQFQNFVNAETAKFAKEAPEYFDPKTATAKAEEAKTFLVSRGFAEDEITHLWTGRQGLSLRDSRVQSLVRDAIRFRNAEAKLKAPARQERIPSTRPGTAASAAARTAPRIADLERNLDRTGKPEDALKLLRARQAQSDRRARAS